jgi:2-polyprenyl-3-methyl-5-hydroxy-6-metoxy-1,4-benzoquinol methylase
MTNRQCEICGATGMQLRYPRAEDYITGDPFEVWSCRACLGGRTLPSPADLGRYYPARYRQYNRLIARILEILYHGRVRRWARLFAAPGSAFEMGCGNGLMLAMLRSRGWRVLGSERTEAAAGIGREQFGLEIVAGGLEAVAAVARFDLVILNQVLEHLDEPAAMLRKLAAMLGPGGKLIIGVPNFASWQSAFGGEGWFHLDVPRHLHHYSPASLTSLLNREGLEIEGISFVSPEHDPYGWVQSVLNRLDRRRNRLTRLLMRIDPPDPVNLAHLGLGCVVGVLAIPLSVISWIARRGALIEVICVRR